MKYLMLLLKKVDTRLIIALLSLLSVVSIIFFYLTINSKGAGFTDAYSRLNISRRITDSLTPGLAQIGGVWLPLPQVFIAPFAAINFLYFSSLAPIFVSAPSFILGGYFMYQLVRRLTKSRTAALGSLLMYGFNPNLLFLQSTAMSEPLFLCSLLGCAYYFTKYLTQKDNQVKILILSAFWAFIASMTRYEGFMLAIFLLGVVFISTLFKTKKLRSAEGTTVLVAAVALLGILLWHMYSWAIFGDPLNWARIYSGQRAVVSSVADIPADFYGVSENKGKILNVFQNLFLSVFQMTNFILIPLVTVSIPALVVMMVRKTKTLQKRSLQTGLVCVLLLAPTAFIVLSGLAGGSLIKAPATTFSSLWNTAYHSESEYNVRYGIVAMPFLIILAAFVFSRKSFAKIIFFVAALLMIPGSFIEKPVLLYSFPRHYLDIVHNSWSTEFPDWFNSHYDGGLVLVSVIAYDPVVYNLKTPYHNFIYEGTGHYWKESIQYPSRYARWIIMKSGERTQRISGSSDLVSYFLAESPELTEYYDLVYEDDKVSLYKMKPGMKPFKLP